MSAGCLGAAGEQTAVTAQYDALGQTLLDLYTREFIAAWRAALARLQLRRLTADKPKYIALGAAAAATSPIKQLLESIRDETALTRERPKPQRRDRCLRRRRPLRLRRCCGNRTRRPAPRSRLPFKAFHVLVEGEATRRPIDAIVANLNEIHQSLTLLATNPSQAALANASLQTQVASLRANANRLPRPVRRPAAQGRWRFRRRCDQLVARAIGACTRRSGHRSLSADRSQPLSVHARQHAGDPARRFRTDVRDRRSFRPFLQPTSHRAGRPIAARLDLAAGQCAGTHALAGDAARVPARGADP